jgi:hypothetical protein
MAAAIAVLPAERTQQKGSQGRPCKGRAVLPLMAVLLVCHKSQKSFRQNIRLTKISKKFIV